MKYKTYDDSPETKKEIKRLTIWWVFFGTCLALYHGFIGHSWGSALFALFWYYCAVIPFMVWWERRKDRKKQERNSTD